MVRSMETRILETSVGELPGQVCGIMGSWQAIDQSHAPLAASSNLAEDVAVAPRAAARPRRKRLLAELPQQCLLWYRQGESACLFGVIELRRAWQVCPAELSSSDAAMLVPGAHRTYCEPIPP